MLNKHTPPQGTQPDDTPSPALDDAAREHLTLSQAARLTPGRVSPNCVWRWCRRGVQARTGGRVRLRHVRQGGKLFTTRRWLDEFGERLALADAAYFDAARTEPEVTESRWQESPATVAPRRGRRQANCTSERTRHAQVDAELEAEGL